MFQIAFMFTELIKNKNFDINIYTEYEHNFLIWVKACFFYIFGRKYSLKQ